MAEPVDICIPFLQDAVGKDLSDAEIQELRGVLNERMKRLRMENAAADVSQRARMAADEIANKLKVATVIERRNAAKQYMARLRIVSHVRQNFGDNLELGLESILVGVNRVGAGARYSVDAVQRSLEGQYIGGLFADLRTAKVDKLFAKGLLDQDVTRALWQMDRAEPNFDGIPAEARKIAEILHKWNETARIEANEAGAWIGKLEGYVQRQGHDMYKIRKAGYEKWRNSIDPLLDHDRTFADFDGDPETMLREIYTGLSTGIHKSALEIDNDSAGVKKAGSMAKKLSANRVLHFKDADAFFQYNQTFGTGNIREATISGLERMANTTGMMRIMGPNPEATYENIGKQLLETARQGDPAKAARLQSSLLDGKLRNRFDELTGATKIPGSEMFAQVSSVVRAVESMAKLGGAVISAFADIPLYASEMRYQGRSTLSGMAEAMTALTQGRGTAEQQEILASLGVFFDSMRGEVGGRFTAHDDLPGTATKMMNAYFKLNGLNWWTETLRKSAALSMSHNLSLNAGKAWGDLGMEFNRILGQFGIDEGKWDLIRSFDAKAADGRNYIVPEGARNLTDAQLDGYLASKGLKQTPARRKELRREIEDQLRSYFVDRTEYAVIEPDARTLSMMRQGTRPGTAFGEIARFIGQFKAFPITVLSKVAGRNLYGSSSRGEAITSMSQMVIMSTLFGYGAMTAKDMLKGKQPRDPLDPRTMSAAFLQGGALGIYGDLLLGETGKSYGQNLTSVMAGPAFGTANDIWDIKQRLQNGDDAAASTLRLLVSHTPGNNLWWVKPGLDYGVMYKISEALNPGYTKRMEKRLRDEAGQEYMSFARPSDYD